MEATVALAVFTIGMLGLGGASSQITHANAVSRQKQIAVLLAEGKLAQLRMMRTAELTQTSGSFEAPFDSYRWEARIEVRSENLNIMDVRLEVVHRSGAAVEVWTQMVGTDDR